MSVKKITTCGVLAALAMAISLLERYVPIDIVLPGLKLGLDDGFILLCEDFPKLNQNALA